MIRRFFVILLVLCLTLVVFAPVASATEPTDSGTARQDNECGEGITWTFAEGVLTITGDGEMDDFEENAAPWQEHMDEIEEVVIEGKLSYIGAYAFTDCDTLLAVSFGSSLREIGPCAFKSCDGLEAVWLPGSFKVFGPSSFESCKGLKEIHCSGGFPSFRQNSMWNTYVTIYYPAERPWGTEYIQQLEEAFKGRVEFLASDGTDHYDPTEATEPEQTEAVPETAAPETVPPTQPQSPETEPSVTEAPAEVPTGAPETHPQQTKPMEEATEKPTEPVPAQPSKTGGIPTGLVIVGAVLIGLFLGYALFGRRKGRYSR